MRSRFRAIPIQAPCFAKLRSWGSWCVSQFECPTRNRNPPADFYSLTVRTRGYRSHRVCIDQLSELVLRPQSRLPARQLRPLLAVSLTAEIGTSRHTL
jgi:hypothetical protein